MNLKIDEEFRSLIPPLADEEREQLKQNIINDGAIREPIAIWHDFIIDGHNRYEISQETGISFNTFSMDSKLEDRNDVMIWMIENQKGRRNLPQPKKNELAYRLKDMYAKRAKKNQGNRTDLNFCPTLDKSNTLQKMADVAGVSRGTMAKYQKLVESGDKELLHQYNEGDISLNAAYNRVMGIEEKPKPNKELEQAQAEIESLKEQLANADNNSELQSEFEREKQKRIEAEQQIAWLKQNPPEPKDYRANKRRIEELERDVATYKAHEEGLTLQQKAMIDDEVAKYKNTASEEIHKSMRIMDLISAVRNLPKNMEVADYAESHIRQEVGGEAHARADIEKMVIDMKVIYEELDKYLHKERKLQVVK